ncbi:hypothetical protein BGZ73_006370 [Actinomortierella ambigua]|nr:hypothetical protein BGZ73_006370 [Actinomortierella ambigua]
MGSTPSKSKPEGPKQPKRLRGSRAFRQSTQRTAQPDIPFAQNPQEWSSDRPQHQWSMQQQQLHQRQTTPPLDREQDQPQHSIDIQRTDEHHHLYLQNLEDQQQHVEPEDETIDYSPMNNYNRQDINIVRNRSTNSPCPESSTNSSSKGRFKKSKGLTQTRVVQEASNTPRSSTSGNRPSFSLLRSVAAGRKSSQMQRPGEKDSVSNQEQHHFSANQPLQISAPILEPESFHASMMDGNDTIWTDEQRYTVDPSRSVRAPPNPPRPARGLPSKSSNIPSPPRASADDANYRPVTQGNVRRRPDKHDSQNKFAVGSPRSGAYKAPAPPLPISAHVATDSREGSPKPASGTSTSTTTASSVQSPQKSWRENVLNDSMAVHSSPSLSSSSDAGAQGTKPSWSSQGESLVQDEIGSDQSGNNYTNDMSLNQVNVSPTIAGSSKDATTHKSSKSKRNGLHGDWLQQSLTVNPHRRALNFQERLLQQPAADDASVISLAGSRVAREDGSSAEGSSARSSMRSSAIVGDEESHQSESEDRVSELPPSSNAAQDPPNLKQQQQQHQQAPAESKRPHSMTEEDVRRHSSQHPGQPTISSKNAMRWSQGSTLAHHSEAVIHRLSDTTPPRSPARRKYRSSGLSSATTSSSSPRSSTISSLHSPVSSRASPRTSQEPPPRLPVGVMPYDLQVRQHLALKSILGAIYRAPIDSQVLGAVLDVGCGSGQWMRAMAQKFPLTVIHGVDQLIPTRRRRAARAPRVPPVSSTESSPTSKPDQDTSPQPTNSRRGSWTYPGPAAATSASANAPAVNEPYCPTPSMESMPNNCFFHKADITTGLPFADNTFDYCHVRLVLWGFRLNSFPSLLEELIRVTKPNGWIEFVDFDPCLRRPGELGSRLNEWIKTGLIHSNMDPDLVGALPGHLETYCEQSRKELEDMLTSSKLTASSPPKTIGTPRLNTRMKTFGVDSDIESCKNYGLSHLKVSKVSVPLGRWGGTMGETWLETFTDFLRCLEPMMTDAALSGLVMDHLHKQVQRRLSVSAAQANPLVSPVSEDQKYEHQRQLEDFRTTTKKTWREMVDQLNLEASQLPTTGEATESSGGASVPVSWSRETPRSYTNFYLAQVQKVDLIEQQQQELLKELEKEILSPSTGQASPLGQSTDGRGANVDPTAALQYHENQRRHHLRHLNSLEGGVPSSGGSPDIVSPRAIPLAASFIASASSASLIPKPFAEGILTSPIQSHGERLTTDSSVPSAPPAPASVAALSIRTNSRGSQRSRAGTPQPDQLPQQPSQPQQPHFSPPPSSAPVVAARLPPSSDAPLTRSASFGSIARSSQSNLHLIRRMGSPRPHSPSNGSFGAAPGATSSLNHNGKVSQYAHLNLKGFVPDYFNQFPPNLPLPPVPTSPIPPVPIARPGSTPPPIGHAAVRRKISLLSNSSNPSTPVMPSPRDLTMTTDPGTTSGLSEGGHAKAPVGVTADEEHKQQQQQQDAVEEAVEAEEEEEEEDSNKEEILIALSDAPTIDNTTTNPQQPKQRIPSPSPPQPSSEVENTEGEEIQMLLVDDEHETPTESSIDDHSQVQEEKDVNGDARTDAIDGATEGQAFLENAPSAAVVADEVDHDANEEHVGAVDGTANHKRGAMLLVDTEQANKYYSDEQKQQPDHPAHESPMASTTADTPASIQSPATPITPFSAATADDGQVSKGSE